VKRSEEFLKSCALVEAAAVLSLEFDLGSNVVPHQIHPATELVSVKVQAFLCCSRLSFASGFKS
jgi:hypothetical protein